jgi:cellobiose phosphorylase
MATFGNFSEDGSEYTVEDALAPPRHLVNFSWNDRLISGVNQFGSGEGVFNNQTLLYNDPAGRARMIRDGRRYFYLRDEDSGAFWNLGWFPVRREPHRLRTTVGVRHTRFHHEAEGIRTEALCFAAPDEPVEIWTIKVSDLGGRPRRLGIYPYVEWLLQGYPIGSDYISYLKSEYHADINAVVSDNSSDERPHSRYSGFVACDRPATGWAGSARQFLGVYGDPSHPEVLIKGVCPSKPTSNEILAGALQVPCALAGGETREFRFLVGNSSDDIAETRRLVRKLFAPGHIDGSFAALLAENEAVAAHTRITTPEPAIDRMVNIWAKNQIQLCTEFGRDGARGFRDALQDSWGAASFRPDLARSKILEALRHQFSGGWTLRGWMPVNDRRYSDGPTWIAPALAEYIATTGRKDLLEESVPWYDGGEATVLEHLLRGLRQLHTDRGERGLCRAHRGDWNDSLDWMGREGRGESVMTTMGLYHSLGIAGDLATEVVGDQELKAEMTGYAEDIRAAVEDRAWDGDWYLQGYSDSGAKVGSSENAQGRIYLPPQAWAALSGLASRERATACLDSALRLLESDHGCLVSSPAYTRPDPNVGRLTVILPGTYENASPYCHGTAFMIAALVKAGRSDEALRLYKKVMPDNAEHPSVVSGVEPWAFTNQYLGPDNRRAGSAVSGWITGTAGWMYMDMLRSFLGFRPGYDGVTIRPCLPSAWRSATLTTTLRGTRYAIEIANEGGPGAELTVDGARIEGNTVRYSGADRVEIKVRLT